MTTPGELAARVHSGGDAECPHYLGSRLPGPCQGGAGHGPVIYPPRLLSTAWRGVWAYGPGLISQFNYC